MITDQTQEALRMMTDVQRRRWRLYLNGRSLSEIAKVEGVSRVAIFLSIKAGKIRARKRIVDLDLGGN